MQNSFDQMPKFQNPEEELDFLRNLIKERTLSSEKSSKPQNIEDVAGEIIEEYREIGDKDILHQDMRVSQKEVEDLSLNLSPEEHDSKMENLLGIILSKGIKNALKVVAEMKNPHIDDDFHRFLVQYLITEHSIPALKEKTPIWKSLNMSLFEVTLPGESVTGESAGGYKEFIGAMEQFYAGMLSVRSDRKNADRNYFTIEVALPVNTDSVVIYVSVMNEHIELFEKQVLAFYQDAKVRLVNDDYNVFNEDGYSIGAYAKLKKKPVFPIKTAEEIEHDPMNPILNTFSKLDTEGEGASIQYIITPVGDDHLSNFNRILKDVKKGEGVKMKKGFFTDFDDEILKIGRDLALGPKQQKEKEKNIDDKAIENITKKINSTIVATSVRVIASAKTKDRAESILSQIESSFNQFADETSNRIQFSDQKGSALQDFFHEYSYRMQNKDEEMLLNLKELSTVFHFPIGVTGSPQLKEARAAIAPAPIEMGKDGIVLGINEYRGKDTQVHFAPEDRLRHFYMIGQTGVGKTTLFLNMAMQDIKNGEGVCYIDPHGTDINTLLANIPPERIDDVIYFDPAYTERPMGLNMLEYDPKYPEQKTFVVNEMMSIFNKLFDMKVGGGAMFEQYFRNSAFLVMEDPESGSTLLEITRVLADSNFRKMKLARCKNPIIKQFWESAEQTTGEQSLANFVPYISSKFDNFISNDIMRPVVLQQNSVFNFRKIMDEKKILLVNLSKGRLGEINANLIGLVLVGKLQMAALSRVDMFGKDFPPFYMYIDEFQNVTTDSISSILSEARKYKLSLNITHQYLAQLDDSIKNAVFGNVGSMAAFRVSSEDAKFIEPRFAPVFSADDIMKIDNHNAYVSMLIGGQPSKPFSMRTMAPKKGSGIDIDKIKQLSYLKYGIAREEVEEDIMRRYSQNT